MSAIPSDWSGARQFVATWLHFFRNLSHNTTSPPAESCTLYGRPRGVKLNMASAVRFSAAAGCGRRAHPAPTTAFRRQQLAAPAGRRRSASRVSRQVMCSAVDTGAGKLISKVEIPAFIPRSDLLDQLMRWSFIEIQEGGVANVGCPCKVRALQRGCQLHAPLLFAPTPIWAQPAQPATPAAPGLPAGGRVPHGGGPALGVHCLLPAGRPARRRAAHRLR